MSSHWDYVARVVAEHDAQKPFAPENGQPLKFKVGDPVIYTNDYGVQFPLRVTGYYRPEEPSSLYAVGRRYLVHTDCYWFPEKETSLALDSGRQAFEAQFSEGYIAMLKAQCKATISHWESAEDWAALCGCPGLSF